MADRLMIDPALTNATRHDRQRRQVARGSVPEALAWSDSSPPQPVAPSSSRATGDILRDYDLAVERAQTWSGPARFGFNAMLASSAYKNKLRLKPARMERIVHFLVTPDAKSREKDRLDAQAKHQSQHWIYRNGNLYRKESRLSTPRRHVSAQQAFDILTAEHLRSGHQGRDKMLKVLEAKYIGYTKDELMYVLDHCTVCASKHIRGAAARRRENKHVVEANAMLDEAMTSTFIDDPIPRPWPYDFGLEQDSEMEESLNYAGAAVFWLYILAALCLSALVIHSIATAKPSNGKPQADTKTDQIIFAGLALVSFIVLSINMLQVLVQSYMAWSQVRKPHLPTNLITLVWTWSITSTLFLDFAEALVQSNARFRWTALSLLMTFGICLFLGIEGYRRRIPRLWAFFGLSQILPISFAQNLFYLAILRSPSPSTTALTSSQTWSILALAAIYCGTISILPTAAGSTWLMPLVLLTRALLLLPLWISEPPSNARASSRNVNNSHPISPWVIAAFVGLAVLLVPITSSQALSDNESLTTVLFSHPAVSTLGCDFVLSLASLALWTLRQRMY